MEGVECCICLDSGCTHVTRCSHTFHLQCIHDWLQYASRCPMCMANIDARDVPVPVRFDNEHFFECGEPCGLLLHQYGNVIRVVTAAGQAARNGMQAGDVITHYSARSTPATSLAELQAHILKQAQSAALIRLVSLPRLVKRMKAPLRFKASGSQVLVRDAATRRYLAVLAVNRGIALTKADAIHLSGAENELLIARGSNETSTRALVLD